ncbi:MAG: EamA family transporter [Lentisphaeria bacterium]|nr:EamA family transporter [Lentisphaeria bacterium]
MMDSLGGFLLVITAGVCWIGVGMVVSKCSARGWDFNLVQGLNYVGATLVCVLLLAGSVSQSDPGSVFGLGFLMSFLAGITNFYSFLFTAKAMERGPNGLVWGIMQSGMIGSFLMGVVIFGEKAAPVRFLGLFLILSGILVMGVSRDSRSSVRGKNWVMPTLAAFLLVMVTQSVNSLPSYLHKESGSDSLVRTFGLYFGGMIGFMFITLPGMIRKRNYGVRGEWIAAVILMVLNVSASLFFFYRGLDLLAKSGCASLGYPVSIGVCVIGFSVYSLLILKEKFARLSLAGLGGVCLGIIIISLQ